VGKGSGDCGAGGGLLLASHLATAPYTGYPVISRTLRTKSMEGVYLDAQIATIWLRHN
jgi:hypothetical protein